MSKLDIDQEIKELVFRFKRLKKALEEENTLSPAQRAAADFAKNMKGMSREELQKKAREIAEQRQAQHLASQLQKRGILGTQPLQRQPTSAEQQVWLANNGFKTEEELAKQESQWGNSINSWLAEATKPLNQRFKSEEEERAYWDRIKVSDNGQGNGGY